MMADWMIVLGIAAGSALVVAVLGLAVLRALRTRSPVLSLAVVALVSVACVRVGARAAAAARFLSSPDFGGRLRVTLSAGAGGGRVDSPCGRRAGLTAAWNRWGWPMGKSTA